MSCAHRAEYSYNNNHYCRDCLLLNFEADGLISKVEPYAKSIKLAKQWLTSNVPYWRERIHWSSLDMSNIRNCILGQLFGNSKLVLDWDTLLLFAGLNKEQATEMCFTLDDPPYSEWTNLTNAWKAMR